ncbi:H-NS family nucleoid-associated regulatory protein [Acidovorax sp. SDU_ACID1]|uniref:H-NS histone family protein n=1 Tax=Acidovorax sp. SDU_ACID1 TaxID=3136632 RepID=UPI003872FEA9
MARKLTILEINQQIAKLQQQADEVRLAEKAEVVARIRKAIPVYGITPVDLFDAPAKRGGRKASGKATVKDESKPTRTGRIKYRDDAGHTWSGYGRKPQWLVAALASGKTEADLLA